MSFCLFLPFARNLVLAQGLIEQGWGSGVFAPGTLDLNELSTGESLDEELPALRPRRRIDVGGVDIFVLFHCVHGCGRVGFRILGNSNRRC